MKNMTIRVTFDYAHPFANELFINFIEQGYMYKGATGDDDTRTWIFSPPDRYTDNENIKP